MKILITYREDRCLRAPFKEVLISSKSDITAFALFKKRYPFPIVCSNIML